MFINKFCMKKWRIKHTPVCPVRNVNVRPNELDENEKDGRCTCNLTMRRFRATIVAELKQ
jgi:hypothetical protein